jgi:hypothetical protein
MNLLFQVSRRVTVDTVLDADEEVIPPDKEEWLRLHPYTPIENMYASTC